MKVYLVRHAKAGSRSRWKGPDVARPLSGAGRRQADDLAKQLGDDEIRHVLTSGYARCEETVAPLAARLGLVVEVSDALAEGGALEPVRALVLGERESAVLCTHGDVIGLLLESLGDDGLDLGKAPALAKGSVWELDVAGDRVTRARYRAPST